LLSACCEADFGFEAIDKRGDLDDASTFGIGGSVAGSRLAQVSENVLGRQLAVEAVITAGR
jgi:hypothetical protein